MERFDLQAPDGTPLKGARQKQGTPRGTVFVAHGLGEHIGRHEPLFRFLGENLRVNVYGVDHRGHGQSGGPRGHIDRFSQYLEDFELLYTQAETEGSPPPYFQLGHSMG